MYTPGVAVPRDVAHLLVPPSVEVVPANVFEDLEHLKEIVLSEGLREIGENVLHRCRSLERVHFPSTLLTIGDCAFLRCTSLKTLHFPEGLVEIGGSAFEDCSSLQRISFSSTVTTIGEYAFADCYSLEVVMLVDGIRTIGETAFRGCPLEGVSLPATLTSMGRSAFESCQSLKTVELSRGIQLIGGRAFNECDLLNHIVVTPKCFVVEKTGEDYSFSFTTNGMIDPNTEFDRVVIASECFHSMRSEEVHALEVAMTEILEMELEWDDECERLRGLLAPYERRRKEEVTSILELGLWKAEMRRSNGTGPGIREACRLACGAEVVIEQVIPFL